MARWLVEEAAELVAGSLRHAMRLRRERDGGGDRARERRALAEAAGFIARLADDAFDALAGDGAGGGGRAPVDLFSDDDDDDGGGGYGYDDESRTRFGAAAERVEEIASLVRDGFAEGASVIEAQFGQRAALETIAEMLLELEDDGERDLATTLRPFSRMPKQQDASAWIRVS